VDPARADAHPARWAVHAPEKQKEKGAENMLKTTLMIEGMQCGMCEAHICDTIRKAVPDAAKVKASHRKNTAEFVTKGAYDEKGLEKAINETGFVFVDIRTEPYEKKGFFH